MTDRYEWRPEYSLGEHEIDEGHKQFFTMCNTLIELSEKEDLTKNEVLLSVSHLGNYAYYHFEEEEQLFKETDYPEIETHIKLHQAFRKEFQKFADKLSVSDPDLKAITKEIADFSVKWITNHILGADQKYTNYIREKYNH